MSDSEARLAHIKELNRIRAKRYYEANKEKVAERRKVQRAECRKAMGKAPAPEPIAVVAPPAPKRMKRPVIAKKAPEPEPEPVAVSASAPKRKRPLVFGSKAYKEAQAKAKEMTYVQAVEIVTKTDTITSQESRKTYLNHLKTLNELLQCQDFVTCFQNAPETIQKLQSAKQKRDPTKGYSINSLKAYTQAILKLSDVLSIPLTAETKQQYVDAFDALKLDSKKQTDERIEEGKKEEQLTFETYLPKVAEKFGEDSKEYLVASLYSINGFRDDLQLRLVRVPDEKQDNQLVIAKPGHPYRILLNTYKTDKKYGVKTISTPPHITKLIRAYIVKNKLKIDGFLLGPNKLTGFISKFNKELGIPVSINTYRQMLVSPVIDEMTSAERVQLAKKMSHSAQTSAHYKQKKK